MNLSSKVSQTSENLSLESHLLGIIPTNTTIEQRKTDDGSADLDLEEQSASFPEIGNNEAWEVLRLLLMHHSANSVTVQQAERRS